MIFFAVFLRKLEPSFKIGAFSATIFGKLCIENGRMDGRMEKASAGAFFNCHSIVRGLMNIMSTRRCGIQILEKHLCSSTMETKLMARTLRPCQN